MPRKEYQTPAEAGESAAPAGGPSGGRGCTIILALMLAAGPLGAEPVQLPSGLSAEFHDLVRDTLDSGLTLRFRFVAPWIATLPDHDAVFADMTFLCNDYARPRLSAIGPQPARIVVTLMSEPTEFGLSNPEIVQFFESYSLSDGGCIWEVF